MELVKLIIGYLENNTWALIFLTFIIIIRKSISDIINRLIRLNFSYGDAHGSIEAAHPTHDSYVNPGIQGDIKDTPETEKTEESLANKEQPNWFSQVYDLLSEGDATIAHKIFEEAQRQELNSDKLHENEGIYYYFSFTLANDQSAIKKLESLCQRSYGDKQLINATFWLSLLYSHINDYESAANLWRRLNTVLTDPSSRTEAKINLAKVEIESDNLSPALTLLKKELKENITNEQRSLIYEEISKIYKQKKDTRSTAIALEKSLEFSQGDREKIFNTAYAQSNSNLNLIAAENYSTLINLEPKNSIALNNLGVCAGEFKNPGKQVELYKRAAEHGNSLAMANLASLYIQSGFFDEAEEILKKAIKLEDLHENVGDALYRLKQARIREEESWKKLLDKAKELKKIIRFFGEALFDCTLSASD